MSGLPNTVPFTSLAAADLGSVFAASMGAVYVTHDAGQTWLIASTGLPAVSGGTDLRYVMPANGSRYLYLGTYGWSLWRAALP